MTNSNAENEAVLQLLTIAFEALSRRDYETVVRGYDPHVVLTIDGGLGIGLRERYVGHEGWREWVEDVHENFDELAWTPNQLRVGDRVWAVEVTVAGRGKTSGAPVELGFGTVYHLSAAGLVERQDTFFSDGWNRALDSAGLG